MSQLLSSRGNHSLIRTYATGAEAIEAPLALCAKAPWQHMIDNIGLLGAPSLAVLLQRSHAGAELECYLPACHSA
jgi:hypothetical protein